MKIRTRSKGQEGWIRSSSIRPRVSSQMRRLSEYRKHKSMHTTEGLIRIHHDVTVEMFEEMVKSLRRMR